MIISYSRPSDPELGKPIPTRRVPMRLGAALTVGSLALAAATTGAVLRHHRAASAGTPAGRGGAPAQSNALSLLGLLGSPTLPAIPPAGSAAAGASPTGAAAVSGTAADTTAAVPAPADGALRLPDGWYSLNQGQVLRDGQAVGTWSATGGEAGEQDRPVVQVHYTDRQGKEQGIDNLLAQNTPTLEASAFQTDGAWWAFAVGQWVRVGHRISGHTYPGFEVSGGGRVTTVALRLMQEVRVGRKRHAHIVYPYGLSPRQLNLRDLDMLQHIADAESGGQIDDVSTYDNQVVSFGVRQWTLGSGRLQSLIRDNAALFAAYGIAVPHTTSPDADPADYWKVAGSMVPRIVGVEDSATLTGPYWTAKFFRAGLDWRIQVAELKLAAQELYRDAQGTPSSLSYAESLSPYFRTSASARALLAELENNRPGYASEVAAATAAVANTQPGLTEEQFLAVLVQEIARPYEDEYVRKAGQSQAAASSPGDAPVEAARAAGDHFAAQWMANVLHLDSKLLGDRLCQARQQREAAAQQASTQQATAQQAQLAAQQAAAQQAAAQQAQLAAQQAAAQQAAARRAAAQQALSRRLAQEEAARQATQTQPTAPTVQVQARPMVPPRAGSSGVGSAALASSTVGRLAAGSSSPGTPASPGAGNPQPNPTPGAGAAGTAAPGPSAGPVIQRLPVTAPSHASDGGQAAPQPQHLNAIPRGREITNAAPLDAE